MLHPIEYSMAHGNRIEYCVPAFYIGFLCSIEYSITRSYETYNHIYCILILYCIHIL